MGKSVNDRMAGAQAGLTITNATAAATAALTTGARLMKIILNNGTVAGSVTVYNATATSGTAGFTVTSVANGSTVVDLAPDGFILLGGAVGVTGSAHFFTVEN